MKTRIILILLIISLSACGFHLRGSQQKSSVAVSKVYLINAGATTVIREVRSLIASAGAEVVSSRANAEFVLRLDREFYDQTVLSVSADTGKVEQYQVTVSVYMNLEDAAGKALVSSEEIRLAKDYTFDEDAVLGKIEEENVIRNELAKDAAAQVIRELNEAASAK
ncbi:MAG: hypothetical protein GKR93_03060 [Gammaproteobacteria bacterium]|nr:hypothetical protein [Gammaproteobacteria bacterium]